MSGFLRTLFVKRVFKSEIRVFFLRFQVKPNQSFLSMKKNYTLLLNLTFLSLIFSLSNYVAYSQDTTLVKSRFFEGLGTTLNIVSAEKKLGVTNDTGLVVMPIIYDELDFFIKSGDSCELWEDVFLVKRNGLFALAGYDGKPITDMQNERIIPMRAGCRTASTSAKVVKVFQYGKAGLVNKNGNVVIRPTCDDLEFITDKNGEIFSPEAVRVHKRGKQGMLLLRSMQPVPAEYDKIEYLQHYKGKDKKTVVLLRIVKDRKHGIMNLGGKEGIEPKFQYIEGFYEDLAVAQQKNKYGYVDTKGKTAVKFSYDMAFAFRDGVAVVKKDGRFGGISKDKKTVLPFRYTKADFVVDPDHESDFYRSLLIVQQSGKFGAINLKGEEIIPFQYEKIEVFPEENRYRVREDGKLLYKNF